MIALFFKRAVPCVILAMAAFGLRSASAQSSTWVNTAGGDFETGGNWDPGVPGTDDWGVFSLNQNPAYTVDLNSTPSIEGLYVDNDRVVLNLNSNTLNLTYAVLDTDQADVALRVGQGSGETGVLTLTGGGTVNAVSFRVGGAAGSYGHLIVDNATLKISNISTLIGPTSIGHQGNGDLTIRNGGSVEYYRLYLARGSAVVANILVEGTNSLLKASNTTTVAYRGQSTLHIRNGGRMEAGSIVISERTTTGLMTVENATTTATTISLGRHRAAGTLRVIAGGSVAASSLNLGIADSSADANAGGIVEIRGAGSMLTTTGAVAVGGNGATNMIGYGNLVVAENGALTAGTHLYLHTRSTVTLDRGVVQVNQNLSVTDIEGSAPEYRLTLHGDIAQAPLRVTGNVAIGTDPVLGGQMVFLLDLAPGFNAGANDVFEVLSFGGTRTGTFAGLAEGALIQDMDSGYEFELSYGNASNSAITLTVTAIPEPGSLVLLALAGAGLLRLRRRPRA